MSDVLFVPANYMIYESVLDSADVFGLSVSVLVPRDNLGLAAIKATADLATTPEADISKHVMKQLDSGN